MIVTGKKYRNTKARQREIAKFSQEWKRAKNKVYYRKKTKGIDYSSSLPVNSKRDLQYLSTREIQSVNKKLEKVNKPDSSFWDLTEINGKQIPKSRLTKLRDVERKLFRTQEKINQVNDTRKIIVGDKFETDLSVYSKHMMTKSRLSIMGNIKPYDITDRRVTPESIERAIETREKRLDPDWVDWRKGIMQDNFIQSLLNVFNDEADDVVSKLRQLDPDDFYDLYEQFDTLDFAIFDSNQEISDDKLGELETLDYILNSFLNGDIDTSGKVFS